MSILAVIVIVLVAAPALALLVAGGRRAARLRARRELDPMDGDATPYRSHAEASRRSGAGRM